MKPHHRKVPRYRLEVNLRLKDSPQPWKWEIYADGDRLYVAQSETGFAARAAAIEAGERELQRWLDAAPHGNGRPPRLAPSDMAQPDPAAPAVDADPASGQRTLKTAPQAALAMAAARHAAADAPDVVLEDPEPDDTSS